MVLFTMDHIQSLWQILLFRYKKYKEEKAFLICNDMYRNYDFLNNMKKERIFEDVIFQPAKFRKSQLTEKDWETQTYVDYEKLLGDSNISIYDFSCRYCTFDVYNDFAVYATQKDMEFNYIESNPMQFNFKIDIYYSILTRGENGDLEHEKLARKYDTLIGIRNANVKSRYVWKKTCEKDIEVDFVEDFYSLGNNEREIVDKCIAVDGLQKNQKISIFFFNNAVLPRDYAKVMIDKTYCLYALIVDIYLEKIDNLWIKDHPNNFWLKKYADKSGLFNNNYIDGRVPIELLLFSKGIKISKAISCDSTTHLKLKDYVDSNLKLGHDVFFFWRELIKLFVTYDIQKYLGDKYRNHFFGISRNLLINYKNAVGEPFVEGEPLGINPSILKGKIFTVVGSIPETEKEKIEIALHGANEDTTVVFWNSDKHDNFLPTDKSLLEYFLTVRIEKKINNTLLADVAIEKMYIFVKNPNTRMRLKKYCLDHLLRYSQCQIKASVLGYHEDICLMYLKMRDNL